MFWISKRKTIRVLTKNIFRGENLMITGPNLEQLTNWHSHSSSDLETVFGTDDQLTKELRDIGFNFSGEESYVRDSQIKSIIKCREVLGKAKRRVEEYGISRNNLVSHPLWYSLGIPVLLAIVSLFLSPVQKLLGISDEEANQAKSEAILKQTEVNFYNWIEEFDADLKKKYDSVTFEQRKRIGLESGASITPIRLFCERERLRRDNRIDSFLVAYDLHGGDTTQLRYSKKLPIGFYRDLVKRFPELINELRSMGIDTL